MQMSVRLRRRVQKGEEMKKKNGPHCLNDQPMNFDLTSHHISYIILAKFIKLCDLEFYSKKTFAEKCGNGIQSKQ